ncbi:MAG TPA: hypothetical protein ENG11_02405, partial [candidate division Zixibacteria bacterium]|nr:hypothetical protein [candidate division Zixibacteria bacterium]
MKRAVIATLVFGVLCAIFGTTTETSGAFSPGAIPDIRTDPEGYARWKAEYVRSLSRRSLARAESPMELRVNNGYVEAVVDNASGEFDEGGDPTGGGAYVKLTFSYTTWSGYSGGTEWVMYYVDGYTAKTDADLPAPDACYTSGDTVIAIWNNWHGVRIRQEILPVSLGATPGASEQILFRAKMYSADGTEHECGCIVYYDT